MMSAFAKLALRHAKDDAFSRKEPFLQFGNRIPEAHIDGKWGQRPYFPAAKIGALSLIFRASGGITIFKGPEISLKNSG
jgi:hypothetical protein